MHQTVHVEMAVVRVQIIAAEHHDEVVWTYTLHRRADCGQIYVVS